MIKGWAMENVVRRDGGLLFSSKIFGRLSWKWPTVCGDPYEASLFRVDTLVAFFASLKFSKLVAASKGDTSGTTLQVMDEILEQCAVALHIQMTKMLSGCRLPVVGPPAVPAPMRE
ncbi:hypothetical protein JRQ81_007044, partial [Phrynocephalus forsythii]